MSRLYIEKEPSYGTRWIIELLETHTNTIYYRLVKVIPYKRDCKSGYSMSRKLFNSDYVPLTDDEKIRIL